MVVYQPFSSYSQFEQTSIYFAYAYFSLFLNSIVDGVIVVGVCSLTQLLIVCCSLGLEYKDVSYCEFDA